MKAYALTVFAKDGEKLLDESFEAADDNDAKQIGQNKLQEHGYEEHTHRCVAPEGHLVLFHR
ncbi:YhzD family protein [Thalassobacillus devorans]|uniref:YhzD family protein n=1 Tax=Thalassobacillus devorans TaxID=279813 RepID=UPI000491FC81|nr:YhzD family protein [Thalassobacillus devorans]